MARVWLFQTSRDRKAGKQGAWYVGWYEGRRKRSKKIGTKRKAREYQARLETAINNNEFSGLVEMTWPEAKAEYLDELLATRRRGTWEQARIALDHAERILRPKSPEDLDRQALATFVATRSRTVVAATVNKDLRQIRAFLREMAKRRIIHRCPQIPFLREPKRIPTYVTPEVFSRLYEACDAAEGPSEQGFTPGDWWRAYLVFIIMTGWRASEPLSLRKADLNVEKGHLHLRAEHTKGDRDEIIPLHPIVLAHLEHVKSFGDKLLPWPLGRRTLWDIFHDIQDAAGVRREDGRRYAFHDLRRGFATLNARRMTADALQALMRHRDYQTTQRYINLAEQLNPTLANLYVPDLPKRKGGGA